MTDTEKQTRELEMEYAQWCATAKSKPNLYDKMCWWHDRALKLAAYGSSEYERGLRDGAKACEEEKVNAEDTGDEGDRIYNQACSDCGAAIRQISDPARPDSPSK